MQKDYNKWSSIKFDINNRTHIPTFKQREIWWCSIGVNIGDEEDGKNKEFNRPVLVVKKFNSHIFLGIPLTTQTKNNYYYLPISFKNKEQSVLLSQFRVFDSKRLINKIGQLSEKECKRVKEAISKIVLS